MEGTLRCTLGSQEPHGHLWKTIHGLSNIAFPPTLNTSITFNNKITTTPKHIANCFSKQFTKHIDPLGLAFLTSMLKSALNTNIISHIWKLASIVPIPKPNKAIDNGTSYRPLSILSVIAKTPEKSILLYITANIANTPTQHGYETQHSTVTALHTVHNTVAKGFNQMAPPARTIIVALDMSQAFDAINIHTLIRKLIQTKILGKIIKFITSYIEVIGDTGTMTQTLHSI